MSKETLNLSIDENLKKKVKRIARKKGISVSRFIEEVIAKEEEAPIFVPQSGSAVERLMNAIPESEKVTHYDYKKLRGKGLKEKYEL